MITETDVVKLIDFGLSKVIKRSNLHQIAGTPFYMAPEVVNGDSYGFKADMWSIGVCLYLLLTLRQPFVGGTPDETRRLMMSGRCDMMPLAKAKCFLNPKP